MELEEKDEGDGKPDSPNLKDIRNCSHGILTKSQINKQAKSDKGLVCSGSCKLNEEGWFVRAGPEEHSWTNWNKTFQTGISHSKRWEKPTKGGKYSPISLRFDKPVLKNIGFRVKKGHIVGLVGKSGAGKSSLLNILSGHLAPNEGEIYLKGNKLQDPSSLLVPGYQQIKIVSQDYQLDPYHTIEENIREAVISLPENEKKRRVKALLSLLKLKDISHIKAIHASGGEQQRLSIARAIALQPDVILLDEPFSNLDAELRAQFFEYILKLRNEENLTIIIVSHDGEDVLGLSDYIYFLHNGKLSSKKTPFNAY